MNLRGRRLVLAAMLLVAPSLACAESALPPSGDSGSPAATMRILSPGDVALYRQIFHEERAGKFVDARAHIAQLSDDCLMGYVLAEHYLSPHSGRTTLTELNDWLNRYGETSIAPRIFKLANRRAVKARADVSDIPSFHRRGGGYEDADLPDQALASDAARAILPQIDAAIRDGRPDDALAVLQQMIAYSPSIVASDIARLQQRIASSYLAEDMDQQAYDLAARTAESPSAPLARWVAGLAAYRLKNYAEAGRNFEALANVGSMPTWTRSAAAFWAARSYGAAGDPLRVVTLLTAAAREQPTFYGILAERILGMPGSISFPDPVVDTGSFLALMRVAQAHRAVALWQLGHLADVPNEMNRALSVIDIRSSGPFAALAHQMGLPNLELRASETAASTGQLLGGLYPIPAYSPEGGYRLDPALVLAFARIESRFQPEVVSRAGARGLMQLMPGTAIQLGGSPDALYDPAYNLALGEKFLAQLLEQMNGNLIEVAASYNAGPGNLTRWMSRPNVNKDPLLFIESMPSPETRNYVKRVLTYHWMYDRRLGRDTPSLDQTAKGEWPSYHPHGTIPVPKAPAVVPDDSTPNSNVTASASN